MKYDDASWHYGGDFPKHLPNEAGGTHIGMYLAWALLAGLASKEHVEDQKEEMRLLQTRDVTPGQYFMKYCDGKFISDDLNKSGNEFTKQYYQDNGKEVSHFLEDYTSVTEDYEDLYEVPDDWKIFDELKLLIDQRFQEWRNNYRTL